jgi:hypothetical protein
MFILGSAGGYEGVEATGGDTITDITVDGLPYRVHTFSSTSTQNLVVGNGGQVEYLIVAGGGSGGSGRGSPFTEWPGGGGGGGYIEGTFTVATGTTYDITVGAGGAARTSPPQVGLNGGNSTAFGLTALGGGGGASSGPAQGVSGGSGGGASGRQDATPHNFFNVGGSGLQPGSASEGFGNGGGGTLNDDDDISGGAGGGGAGGGGSNGTNRAGGAGGSTRGCRSGCCLGLARR